MKIHHLEPATRVSLLVRLRDSRDEQAWGEFAAIYEPVIYRMITRRGLQDADAREIVQEVLMSVSASIGRFDLSSGGSFRGWLSRITRNATIDRLRQWSTRHESVDASGVLHKLDQDAVHQHLVEEFDHDRRQQLFRWAASQVRQRTEETKWMAFWKTSVEGRAITDVSKELGMSEGGVYVARCRILRRIRELVHERLGE